MKLLNKNTPVLYNILCKLIINYIKIITWNLNIKKIR